MKKKIIKLKESDLHKIVKRVMSEQTQPNTEEVVMGCIKKNVSIGEMTSLPMSCINMIISKDITKLYDCMTKIDQEDAELIWSKIDPISKCVEDKLGSGVEY